MQWFKTRKRLIHEIDLLTSENERVSKALLRKTVTVNTLLRTLRMTDLALKKAESKNAELQGKIKELEKEIAERDFMEGFMEDGE